MRKWQFIVLFIGVGAATLYSLWMATGREVSTFIDRVKKVPISSTPITRLGYQGSGNAGIVRVNDLKLSLPSASSRNPTLHVGTTKDSQLALSFAGKVFPFGPGREASLPNEETLAATVPEGDEATISVLRSMLGWTESFRLTNVIWKRHVYYEIRWRKASGAKLHMLWRHEQSAVPVGVPANWTRDQSLPNLIEVEIEL